jgi:ActR/RegA family two-component response regulator
MDKLPDPLRSHAVLIGVGNYRNLSPLPAVHNNLTALATAFQSDRVWGLPSQHCAIVKDPETIEEMLDPLVDSAQNATDTLLLYYAGHGLVDPLRSELHLTRPGSDPQRMHTAVPYNQVRDALLNSSAIRRIVILDCCYSGRALGQMSDPVAALAEEASVEGTFILAAAAENKTALSPTGQLYTAFTGVLLDTMNNGIAGRGPVLDLDSIYMHLRAVMAVRGLPLPQKRDRNTAGRLNLIRNQAFSANHRHSLVVVDCQYLVLALQAALDGDRDSDPGRFREVLHQALSFLADLGEVRVYAVEISMPTAKDVLEATDHIGATAVVVSKLNRVGKAFDATVDMVTEAASALRTADELILVVDDSDFVPVIEQARTVGVVTTVACFPEKLNHELSIAADQVTSIPILLPSVARTSVSRIEPERHEEVVRVNANPSRLPIVRNLLIADGTTEWCDIYERAAAKVGFNKVKVANNLSDAVALIDEVQFSVALLEIGLDIDDDRDLAGLLVMEKIRAAGDETNIVIVTGWRGRDVLPIVRDAIKKYQAYDVLSKATIFPKDLVDIMDSGQRDFETAKAAAPTAAHLVLSANMPLETWNARILTVADVTGGVKGLHDFVDQLLAPFLPIAASRNEETEILDSSTNVIFGRCWSRPIGRAIAYYFAESKIADKVMKRTKASGSLMEQYEVDEVLDEYSAHGLAGAVFGLTDERDNFVAI